MRQGSPLPTALSRQRAPAETDGMAAQGRAGPKTSVQKSWSQLEAVILMDPFLPGIFWGSVKGCRGKLRRGGCGSSGSRLRIALGDLVQRCCGQVGEQLPASLGQSQAPILPAGAACSVPAATPSWPHAAAAWDKPNASLCPSRGSLPAVSPHGHALGSHHSMGLDKIPTATLAAPWVLPTATIPAPCSSGSHRLRDAVPASSLQV